MTNKVFWWVVLVFCIAAVIVGEAERWGDPPEPSKITSLWRA